MLKKLYLLFLRLLFLFLDVDELQEHKILTAHDFDAGIVLRLLKSEVRIVGIPMQGDVEYIENQVRILVSSF